MSLCQPVFKGICPLLEKRELVYDLYQYLYQAPNHRDTGAGINNGGTFINQYSIKQWTSSIVNRNVFEFLLIAYMTLKDASLLFVFKNKLVNGFMTDHFF